MWAVRRRQLFDVLSARLTQRPCRKVSAVAVNDVVSDVSDEQTKKDGADAAADFCGEPFADNGQLLASLSPLLFSMKLFGLYFHRQHRPARRPTDDPEWNPATTTTTTTTDARSTRLRIYATVVLILAWLNAVRFVTVFTSSDHFGPRLLMKIAMLLWFVLIAVTYTAYYRASHSGKLLRVLENVRVTADCLRGTRRIVMVLTALAWMSIFLDISIGFYLFFISGRNGEYDFLLAPFFIHIDVPEDKIPVARAGSFLVFTCTFPTVFFSNAMIAVLVYVFCSQYWKLRKELRRAIGPRGQFSGDLSSFRLRHQALSRAVDKVDGFMMLNNVAGFVCHIASIIILLYSIVFYPESTSDCFTTLTYVFWLGLNVKGMLFVACTGIVVNHGVRTTYQVVCFVIIIIIIIIIVKPIAMETLGVFPPIY